jgi:hypothetical protein
LKSFASILLLLTLASCDCYRTAEGIIVDSQTKAPIAEVQLVNDADFEQQQTDNLATSDSLGHFEYADVSGGMFGCPDLILVYSKPGYRTTRVNVSNGSDTILLEKNR